MKITLYMMRSGVPANDSALRAGHGYKAVPTRPLAGVQAVALLVRSTRPTEADWVAELRRVTNDPLSGLNQQGSSAVLMLEQSRRTYAVTFGSGFQALDPTKIERGFGLRVAVNVLAGGRIKSADTRGLNREGRSAKVIVPVASALEALGIEPSEEWVRQLSGPVRDQTFASSAAGSDSLRLNVKDFNLLQLPKKLKEIAKHWRSKAYKKDFGFIDNFTPLAASDPRMPDLDAEVTRLVLTRDPGIFFAAPDPFEQLSVERFALRYRKYSRFDELSQEAIYDALAQLNLPSADVLRKIQVEAYDGDGKIVDKAYSLYDYVQAEVLIGGLRYVLSAGIWFQVDEDYVNQVHQAVAALADLTSELNLPTWQKKADGKYLDEGNYNKIVATSRSWALLDKDNLYIEGQQKIEMADLLTPDRHLICVKRANRSSTLSHLFSQGSVSVALMHHEKYQAKLATGLQQVGISDAVPPSEWTIVYAIGIEKSGNPADSLFFFSQVNLLTHVRDIRSRNVGVAIALIPLEP